MERSPAAKGANRKVRKTPKRSRARRAGEPKQTLHKPATPWIYTQALADEICRRLSEGESLRSICRDPAMPNRQTVLDWLEQRKDFSGQYARAREHQYAHWADEILDIADDGSNDYMERQTRSGVVQKVYSREHVERSRLRVEARKWALSKLLPKKYGNRVGIEASGRDGEPIGLTVEARNAIIDNILKQVEPKPDNERTRPDEARKDGEHGQLF